LRDLANLGFLQARPAFDKRRKNFSQVVARARLDAQIVLEISEMNGGGLAKRILAETSPLEFCRRARCSLRNSASFASATLKCDVLSDFQTSLPPAKALA